MKNLNQNTINNGNSYYMNPYYTNNLPMNNTSLPMNNTSLPSSQPPSYSSTTNTNSEFNPNNPTPVVSQSAFNTLKKK